VNVPLADVVSDVAAYFNQNIVIENEEVKSCRIYIPLPFKEPDIQSILKAVAISINGSFKVEGNQCIIQGGHCK
jgi:hypothetical protein